MACTLKPRTLPALALSLATALTACGPRDNGEYPGLRMTDFVQSAEIIVNDCLAVILSAEGQAVSTMEQIGFTRRPFGYAKDIGGVFRLGVGKDGRVCGPTYGNVSPRARFMVPAVARALARRGYRPTGETVNLGVAHAILNPGSRTAKIYSNGSNRVGLDVVDGSSSLPLQLRLSRQ